MQVSNLLAGDMHSPTKKPPAKSICFELLLDERSKTRARIPLRVQVNTHDTTESIVTTVQRFYGIYETGVSFEDARGNILIASYDNFAHDSTIYVRSIAGPPQQSLTYPQGPANPEYAPESPRRPSLAEPFQMLPPHMREHSQSPTRSSRHGSKRSVSPSRGRGRRSGSHQQRGSQPESRGSSVCGSHHDDNFSDSDAGHSSISGSRRARSEHFASSEISAANVLQDTRRGLAVFNSETLPMFKPPQMPIVAASQSSVSPQRRSAPHEGPSPMAMPQQKLYDMSAPPLASPQSYNMSAGHYNYHYLPAPISNGSPHVPHGHRLRERHSSTSLGRSGGILPTPDPTVASCISDEDVARTLIALGDASNFSHGRTSTSTLDETFSGVADAPSSTGATSDSDEASETEDNVHKHKRSVDEGDADYEHDTNIKSEFDEHDGPPKAKKIKTKMHDGPGGWRPPQMGLKSTKPGKPKTHSLIKAPKPSVPGQMKAPALPSGQPRKVSSSSSLNMSLGIDEEDLSTKPRCQRCRKSKKGCDRQRPCGRCKDAGIGIEGCVSEDEGNGRKGRYGRHMGVPVKKGEHEPVFAENEPVQPTTAPQMIESSVQGSPSKKRKR